MIAHKNRKQKIIMGSYFLGSCHRRKIKPTENPPSLPSYHTLDSTIHLEQFPPLPSSLQACINASKKLKSLEIRVEPTTSRGTAEPARKKDMSVRVNPAIPDTVEVDKCEEEGGHIHRPIRWKNTEEVKGVAYSQKK
jgi:hypothetical protein